MILEQVSRPALTNEEFLLFQSLIHKKAGIYLSESKKALLVGRISKRLQQLNMPSFLAYYRYIIQVGETELTNLINLICTHETHFFREPQHFDFLVEKVFPEWIKKAECALMTKRLQVWSAGCSTGEEPYSLAMILLEYFPASSGWEVEILATDLSTRILEQAQMAIWPITKSSEIPNIYLKRFMLRGVSKQEGKFKASSEIRSLVRFHQLNLNDEAYPISGKFDLIFCRNVLIYFNNQTKAEVINKLLKHLSPAGYLFLGHAENLHGLAEGVQRVVPTIYTHIAKGK